ncbi:hypothetical protein ACHAXA_011575, partial [Cyclostephanos tholiformis]
PTDPASTLICFTQTRPREKERGGANIEQRHGAILCNMKFSRRNSHPTHRLGRTSLSLLVCVVFCLALSWTLVLVSFPLSMRMTPKTSSLPLLAMRLDSERGMSWKVRTPRPLDSFYIVSDEQRGQNEFVYNLSNKQNGQPSWNNKPGGIPAADPITKTSTELQPSQHNQTAPLSSLIYPLHAKSGTHHAYLYIGTPPQRQTLIVDTGSRLTAFPCHPHCSDCGKHASEPFYLNESSSHTIVACDKCRLNQVDFQQEENYFSDDGIGGKSENGLYSLRRKKNTQAERSLRQRASFPKSCQCGIDQKYTEGSSYKAFEVKDRVWLGLNEVVTSVEEHDEFATPFVFGCQVSEKGLFKSQYADGIMGLSMYTQMLVGVFSRHGSITHESFSLCLNRAGGHISLGGIALTYDRTPDPEEKISNEGRLLTPMKFTPFAKLNVWYYTVTVTSISVGQAVLPNSILRYVNDHKGTIIDSGTTDTFISHKLENAFTSAWETIVGKRYHNRLQEYTYQQFNELPVISFELQGGVQWEIKPESYMEADDVNQYRNETNNKYDHPSIPWEGTRKFTSRIYVNEPAGVVLGSNAMMDKEIFFDVANKRIGVAKATCIY